MPAERQPPRLGSPPTARARRRPILFLVLLVIAAAVAGVSLTTFVRSLRREQIDVITQFRNAGGQPGKGDPQAVLASLGVVHGSSPSSVTSALGSRGFKPLTGLGPSNNQGLQAIVFERRFESKGFGSFFVAENVWVFFDKDDHAVALHRTIFAPDPGMGGTFDLELPR